MKWNGKVLQVDIAVKRKVNIKFYMKFLALKPSQITEFDGLVLLFSDNVEGPQAAVCYATGHPILHHSRQVHSTSTTCHN